MDLYKGTISPEQMQEFLSYCQEQADASMELARLFKKDDEQRSLMQCMRAIVLREVMHRINTTMNPEIIASEAKELDMSEEAREKRALRLGENMNVRQKT